MSKKKPFNYLEWLATLVPGCLVKFGEGMKPAEVIGRTTDDWSQIVVALDKKHYYFHAASGRQCTESKVKFGEYSLYPWTEEDDKLVEQARLQQEKLEAERLEREAAKEEEERLRKEKATADIVKYEIIDRIVERAWGFSATRYCNEKYTLKDRYSIASLERMAELINTIPLEEGID